jgi:sRNA-binding regulator protein Hfq
MLKLKYFDKDANFNELGSTWSEVRVYAGTAKSSWEMTKHQFYEAYLFGIYKCDEKKLILQLPLLKSSKKEKKISIDLLSNGVKFESKVIHPDSFIVNLENHHPLNKDFKLTLKFSIEDERGTADLKAFYKFKVSFVTFQNVIMYQSLNTQQYIFFKIL